MSNMSKLNQWILNNISVLNYFISHTAAIRIVTTKMILPTIK